MVGMFASMLRTPSWVLMPMVVIVSFAGVYSINHSLFDIIMMTLFGLGGYVLRKMNISLVPMVLGALLGEPMEMNLRRALGVSNGDWSILLSSPLSIGLNVITVVILAAAFYLEFRRLRSERRERLAAAMADE
jgi:putative tricarboxylic transport membrane protein